ncbi:hypothetical protein DY000_02003187 [Brassica cretica]|uniref:Uncharacterized protein n=1 Tax=Brassica cretica TaxID=69181 RepID=A0ABQ7CCP5_BRACR|nr:hypothetical protein DY000_02003187 [Brassica cretica]
MLGVSNLSKQFEILEEQVNSLNEAVYDLTVQVHSLEKEELERLTKRVEEAEQVMLGVSNLSKQFERLEEQVNSLNEAVYDLTVQVHSLEKVCFD